MKRPRTYYARGPDGAVAYQVVGDGSIDLGFLAPGAWNIDLAWDSPRIERFLSRLSSFSRLILYNPRGYTISDPIPLGAPPSPEEWNMDLVTVMGAAGSETMAILAPGEIVPFTTLFAASFPERIHALALVDGYAMLHREPDYPWGVDDQRLEFMERGLENWGTAKSLALLAP